jgi:hypothetical protein
LSWETAAGLVLALASAVITNLAYVREHDAAAALPPLSLRRPWQAARLLLGDRAWLAGFAMESGGFLLYAVALALASLALVQSVGAGGIGVLAFVTARLSGRRLPRREWAGVALCVAGLTALGVSLAGGAGEGGGGSIAGILAWLFGTAAAAVLVLAVVGGPVADGIAGGLLFSIGDVSTKVVTQGGLRALFVVGLIAGYTLGTARLQVGYQAGGALTVAGLATVLTNAVPIAAGTFVLGEPVPSGGLGVLRVVAFAMLIAGAVLLAGHSRGAAASRPPPRRAGPRDDAPAGPASPPAGS